MKRLALLTLLLASTPLVAAPAPLPKPQRKAERPAAQQSGAIAPGCADKVVIVNLVALRQPIRACVVIGATAQAPAQPPNADPPG